MASEILEKNNNNPKFHTAYNDKNNDDFVKDKFTKKHRKLISSYQEPVESEDEQFVVSLAYSNTHIDDHHNSVPESDLSLDKPSDTDSEPETDAYNFTEDQQRAMMELMAQKQEAAELLDDKPSEYNVKVRLEQLNAELAKDPTPIEEGREHKVGFKAEIVDLVAPPPPDFSDDESQPSSISRALRIVADSEFSHGEGEKSIDSEKEESEKDGHKEKNDKEKYDNKEKDDNENNVISSNSRQFVVEQDGQFALLRTNEFSPSEPTAFSDEGETQNRTQVESGHCEVRNEISCNKRYSSGEVITDNTSSSQVLPRPPSRPRPNTAFSGSRRNVHPPVRSSLTRSAGQPSNSSASLNNLNYNSPYAMTPQQKEAAKEMARKLEEERKEKEKRDKEEVEKRRRENDSAFQAWLCRKREKDRKTQGAEEDSQKSEQERETIWKQDFSEHAFFRQQHMAAKHGLLSKLQKNPLMPSNLNVIGEYSEYHGQSKGEENEEAYRAWLKEKKTQGKKEKLLKRRQQQEKADNLLFHSTEECEKAFKEWLKKKNAALKNQNATERQINRIYKWQVKRSKKIQAIIKVLKESQASQFSDNKKLQF